MKRLETHSAGVEIRGRWVIRDFSIRFQSGEMAAVIGPNGAGKSTLLRVLAGLQHLSEGRVTLDGADLDSFPRSGLARSISFVPQNTYLPFAFSVREVVATGRNPHLGRFQRERDEDRASIEEALAITDTEKLSNRFVTELSGGERQRVMIARSLATKASIVLMDEPTANLDPAHAIDVLDLCRRLAAGGKLVILTTQDLSMAARYADRVVLIKSGVVFAAGTRDEVLTEPAVTAVFEVSVERAFTANGHETLLFHRGDRESSFACRRNRVGGIER